MRVFKLILICAIISMAMLSGCHSTSPESSESEEEDTVSVEEELTRGVTDTIDGKKVSQECAKLNYNLEDLLQRIENVKSPDMLMRVRAEYRQEIDSILNGINELPSNEKNIINTSYSKIKSAYAEACNEYEVPAEGVIENLKNCIRRVGEANSKPELERFMDCRIGMLNDLDIIYLSVEENSPRIREVQSLAHQLKNDLYDKKVKFGIQ